MGGDVRIQRGDDFGGRSRLVLQIVGVLEQFAGDRDARLQALGGAEIRQQPVLQGDFLDLINDRLGLL